MITQYQADDGAIFATEAEMMSHEQALDAARIEAWIGSVESFPRGEAARAARLVRAFLDYERRYAQAGARAADASPALMEP